MNEDQKQLQEQVEAPAESALNEKGYVSPIDVFLSTGRLAPKSLKNWRDGRLRCLELAIHGNLSRISRAMAFLRKRARDRNLKPSETVYRAHTRGARRDLRFSKSGNSAIERLYRTHYLSPELAERKRAKQREKQQDVAQSFVPQKL